MTTWLIPMSSQDEVKSLKSQDPISLSSCRSQKYIVFLRYIRGGRGVRRYVTNVTFIFFCFLRRPLGLVLLLKTTTGFGVEALAGGGGSCVITCPVPCLMFGYWAGRELTGTGGDNTDTTVRPGLEAEQCGLQIKKIL